MKLYGLVLLRHQCDHSVRSPSHKHGIEITLQLVEASKHYRSRTTARKPRGDGLLIANDELDTSARSVSGKDLPRLGHHDIVWRITEKPTKPTICEDNCALTHASGTAKASQVDHTSQNGAVTAVGGLVQQGCEIVLRPHRHYLLSLTPWD
jgi:hypothetical protein